MKFVKIFGFLLLVAGIILFTIPLAGLSINGAVIGISETINQDYFILIGMVLLIVSVMLLTSRSGIEAIFIPTGNKEANVVRAEEAVGKYNQTSENEKPYLFISGKISRDALGKIKPDAEVREIYTILRQAGVKPSQMILESQSTDTLENFLYSLEKFREKGINEIRISTSPIHYARFKLFEREAKKQGLLDESFEMKPIYTKQTLYDTLYGTAAYIKDSAKIRLNNPFKTKTH